jgi:hypothetical protein
VETSIEYTCIIEDAEPMVINVFRFATFTPPMVPCNEYVNVPQCVVVSIHIPKFIYNVVLSIV